MSWKEKPLRHRYLVTFSLSQGEQPFKAGISSASHYLSCSNSGVLFLKEEIKQWRDESQSVSSYVSIAVITSGCKGETRYGDETYRLKGQVQIGLEVGPRQ